MPRPLVAKIHIDAMQHNLQVAAAHAPAAKLWAVVKADAYGHGLLRGLRGFAAADGLALIEFDNAMALRAAGWQKPILMLEGFFDTADLHAAAQHDLTCVVHCEEQLRMLECALAARHLASPLDIYLKLNSGMNRLGFRPAAFDAAHRRLQALDGVRTVALMTHFANADVTDAADAAATAHASTLPLAQQVACFGRSTDALAGQRSLANSATNLLHPALQGQWARPGIMLYGGAASATPAADFGLQPAMTLTSELIATQDIAAGESVGYGSRFVAPHAMRIGIVACGYADGYPRHAPDGTPVLVDGVRTGLAGRVSMDMLMVDLSPVPGARVGSAVVLWGRGLPIDEVAQPAGTIGYELMCALAARVRVVDDCGDS